MTAKRKLTMYCTPAMKGKLQALAKRSGCSMDCFIEACFRFAIYHFDGKITEVLKLLLQLFIPARRGESLLQPGV